MYVGIGNGSAESAVQYQLRVAVNGPAHPVRRIRRILDADTRAEIFAANGHPADVVVCVGATGEELVELVRDARRANGDVQAIAVCAEGDVHLARRVTESGVAGIVYDKQLEHALIPTIHMVAQGLLVFPRELRMRTVPPTLSHRERQVLALLVDGRTNGEIARELFLSESTVKSHLSTAFTKLGVRKRRDAAAMLLEMQSLLPVDLPATS